MNISRKNLALLLMFVILLSQLHSTAFSDDAISEEVPDKSEEIIAAEYGNGYTETAMSEEIVMEESSVEKAANEAQEKVLSLNSEKVGENYVKEQMELQAAATGPAYVLSQFDFLYAECDNALGFTYNDGFFFLGSQELSPDLAKVSICLASAAYNYSKLQNLLSDLGCSYTPYNYNKEHTPTDNDFVRFTIATREVTFEGTDYIIYIVPVQGTNGGYDWNSNFNIGTGANHTGFYLAHDEIMNALQSKMASDEYTPETRMILTTGHSRGAAVSNIVAGELTRGDSSFILPGNVFSYNFACPAVSTSANETYENIYNLNSDDDAIPAVPLRDWGYKRYGITVPLRSTDRENVRQRFIYYTSKQYEGSYNTPIFLEDCLERMIPNNTAANEPVTQAVFAGIASLLNNKNNDLEGLFDDMGIIYSKAREEAYKRGFEQTTEGFEESLVYWSYVADILPQYLAETADMENEGYEGITFQEWFDRHRVTLERMETVFGYNISSRQDLQAIQFLVVGDYISTKAGFSVDATTLTKLMTCGVELFIYFKEAGGFNAIVHGHMSETYILWINSMYFGNSGWAESTELVALIRDPVLTIGKYCFSESMVRAVSPLDGICHIAQYAFVDSALTAVTLPSSLRSISDSAFLRCSGLTELTIGENVTTIGKNAFGGCIGLTELTIPENVTTIGSDAFANCRGLETIVFNAKRVIDLYKHDSVFDDAGTDGDGITVVFGDSVERIPAHLFRVYGFLTTAPKIESVIIGQNVISIGPSVFEDCKELTKLVIPSDVENIDSSAFNGCTGIKSAGPIGGDYDFEYGWTETIPTYPFNNFTSLESVVFPESITTISGSAFSGHVNLTSAPLPLSLQTIGYSAFYGCSGLIELTIGENVTTIGSNAFQNCTGLETINYNAKNTADLYSGDYAFSNAGKNGKGISVVFGDNVERIPAYLFNAYWYSDYSENPNIISVVIGENVESIGDSAFNHCIELTKLVIPVNVETVESSAFYNCTGIKTAGPIGGDYDFEYGWTETIPTYPFNNFINLESVVFPESITTINSNALCGNSLEIAFFEGSQEEWNRVAIQSGNDSLNNVKSRYYSNRFSLPADLTTIEDEAFSGISAQQIILPDDTTSIGHNAFAECDNLQLIQIPDSSIYIESDAFDNSPSVAIYAPAHSTVEEYAKSAGIPFIAMR